MLVLLRRNVAISCLLCVGSITFYFYVLDKNTESIKTKAPVIESYFKDEIKKNQTINGSNEKNKNISNTRAIAKPVIYLHVGPLKTASTTIQWVAQQKSVRTAALNKDNLMIITTNNMPRPIRYCYKYHRKDSKYCGQDLKDIFHELHNNSMLSNRRLLVSHERISAFSNAELWKFWEEALIDWDVQIILVYRRTYEWILSFHNQIYKMYHLSSKNWKDAKRDIGSISQIFNSTSKHSLISHAEGPMNVIFFFKGSGHKIELVNIHSEGDVAEDFFCKHIERANATCAAAMKTEIPPKKMNKSEYHGYDRIAIAAYNAGFVNKSVHRDFTRSRIKSRHEVELGLELSNLPMKCASQTDLDTILNLTIQQERILFPHFSKSALGEKRLRNDFEASIKQRKFCEVDTKKVLSDQGWIDFFANLKE